MKTLLSVRRLKFGLLGGLRLWADILLQGSYREVGYKPDIPTARRMPAQGTD